MTDKNGFITVETTVKAPVDKVWRYWTEPQHVIGWNYASEDWHSPFAENDLRVGGRFRYRMEAKDGSFGFDFSGTYHALIIHELIAYTLDDDRKVRIAFSAQGSDTHILETFEAEGTNSFELQRKGWQAILNNFKHYAENQ